MRISDWSSDVCSSDLFSATLAGQRDNGHFAIVRRFYRPDYVGRVPAGGNGKQDITRPTQRVDLALEDGIETIIVADSGKDRGVGVKGDARQGKPVALEAADRTEERRAGKECVSTCRSRGGPDN